MRKKSFTKSELECILRNALRDVPLQLWWNWSYKVSEYVDMIFNGVDIDMIIKYNDITSYPIPKHELYNFISEYELFYNSCWDKEKKYFHTPTQLRGIKSKSNKTEQKKKSPWYIYFVINDKWHIKIWRTKNIKNRISSLQTSSSTPLLLLWYYNCDDMVNEEKVLHEEYKHRIIYNEWFDISKEDIEKRFTSYNITRNET